jgi:hypothetical protein
MNYQFDKENISQHIVKFGVHIQPTISPKDDKTKLQDYCNWLIGQFPEVFETLIVGPNQLQVQKVFVLASTKRLEMPTLVLTGRGPVLTLPQRVFIDQIHDLDIPEKDKIFRRAIDELRVRFSDRKVLRVGVVHEFVFDTGQINSLEIIASNLKNDLWREAIKSLRILLEMPREGKNINLEIRPTYVSRAATSSENVPIQDIRFGIIVNVDINNQQIKGDLTKAEINDILAFANDYVPEEMIKFLNNEY